jgi:2-polyprenyl-3-methyl-5-hydroxy-6-metoxy-1,4-benzoquinol methylase
MGRLDSKRAGVLLPVLDPIWLLLLGPFVLNAVPSSEPEKSDMMYNTDDHWKQWGEQDPYFGVLSRDKFRKENIDDNRTEFFESGGAVVSRVISMATRQFGQFNQGSALDFGSGVGRLTIPLAQRFKNVVGVEISEAMIAEAQRNCQLYAVGNVDFVKSDDHLSRVAQKFDFVNSCIVLQHIPPRRGMTIISGLLHVLNPGGVIALHFPVRRRLPRREQLVYAIKHNVPFTRYCFNLLRGRRLSEPLMQWNEYNLVEVMALCSASGIREFALHTDLSEGMFSVILVGRKDA